MAIVKRANVTTILCAFALLWSNGAQAFVSEVWGYLSRYQFGLDYTSSNDNLELSYETDQKIKSSTCVAVDGSKDRQRCGTKMESTRSSGFGVFLQQAFKKKGLLYWNFDVGFNARYLQGELPESEANVDGLPLRSVKFSLAALVVKPYAVVGITPERWPDILVSLGPALQIAGGTVGVNDSRKHVFLGTGSGLNESGLLRGFTQLEIVFWRFGDGALSLFTARDYTGTVGSEFYPGEVDGMSKFQANFVRGVGGEAFGLGAKLLLNWP